MLCGNFLLARGNQLTIRLLLLLVAICVSTNAFALGMAAPATAADLAARPYTKAPPPMLAPIYDWTGFYIGGNGGWGSEPQLLGFR